VFAVVEHQQESLVPQRLDDGVAGPEALGLAEAEDPGGRRRDQVRIGERRQVEPGDAMREPLASAAGHFECQAGFANSTRTG
jgi:hypothetical protein